MSNTALYPWTINGTSVQTLALNLDGVDGWQGWPGRRGNNQTIPYRHGSYSFPRKSLNPGQFLLNVVAMSTDANGEITHAAGGYGHLYENIDTLMSLLYSTSFLDVRHPTPEGVERQAMSEVLATVPVTGKNNLLRSMAVLFMNPTSVWRELPAKQDVTSGLTTTGSSVFTTGGNAPIGDAVITIDCTADGSNPKLTGPGGDEILSIADAAVNGDQYIIDIGDRKVTKNGTTIASGVTISRGWWLEIPPATTNYTLTWTATSGTWDVTVDWYDKWF